MSEDVGIERLGDVLAITLQRPERRNAITVAMYSALADAMEGAADDESLRLITIRGLGPDFTAGNDLGDFLQALPRTSEDIPVWRLLRALAANTIPILAAVQGNAVGIGTTMLLHCDLVLAEESARFSLPFVDLGLVPEAASSLLLPRLAGRRLAARYLLLGDSFGAEEALAIGVASHVVAKGELAAAFDDTVRRLLAKPREALALTQKLLRTEPTDSILERMQVESGHFAERLQSHEVKDAISSFFQRKSGSGS